jgi:hypothetical protein
MTAQTQRVFDELVIAGSSTYGADRLKLPRLRIGYENTPFTNQPEDSLWFGASERLAFGTRTPTTERTLEVCVVGLAGALPLLTEAFRAQSSAIQYKTLDAFPVSVRDFWVADPGCIFEIHKVDAPVFLEGPDSTLEVSTAAMKQLAAAYAAYEGAIRAAEEEEADDWIYAD